MTSALRRSAALRPLRKRGAVFASGLALASAFAAAAAAQQQDLVVNVRNAGAFACGKVLPALSDPGRELEKTAFLQWTGAYATAAARSNSLVDVFPLADTAELVAMTALVCREDPSIAYEAALRTTIGRLRNYWIRGAAEAVSLKDPAGRTVVMYKAAVAPLQRDLARTGATLSVDGAYGNQTGNAVAAINAARNGTAWLTPDGTLLYLLTRP